MSNIDIKSIWPEWKIESILGEGSFGKVYKAVREEYGMTTYSAIKLISIPQNEMELKSLRSEGWTEVATKTYFEGIVNDFVNEIKMMESMKGTQNIVSVEDYRVAERAGEIGWDIAMRMELLTSFVDYSNSKNLTEQDIVKLGVDILSALELCSQKNIIHRDIKPENIFVSSFGHFKLGDFGIARELEKTTGAMSQKGTYNYMAPEVALGRPYNATVDTYSLGIVLYKLLNNNRLPFLDPDAEQIQYQDRKAAVDRRLAGEPLPPLKGANEALGYVIRRACAFNSDDRFQTAQEFKAALSAIATSAKIRDMESGLDILPASTSVPAPVTAAVPLNPAVYEDNMTVAVRRAPDVNTFTPQPQVYEQPQPQFTAPQPQMYEQPPQQAYEHQYVQPQTHVPFAQPAVHTFGKKENSNKTRNIIIIIVSIILLIGIGVGLYFIIDGDLLFTGQSSSGGRDRDRDRDDDRDTPASSEQPEGFIGTWKGTGTLGDHELTFNSRGEFYEVFYASDYSSGNFYVTTGTYTESGHILRLTTLRSFAYIDGGWIEYIVYIEGNEISQDDIFNRNVMIYPIITITVSNDGVLTRYDNVSFTRGEPSGNWSFGKEATITLPPSPPPPPEPPSTGSDVIGTWSGMNSSGTYFELSMRDSGDYYMFFDHGDGTYYLEEGRFTDTNGKGSLELSSIRAYYIYPGGYEIEETYTWHTELTGGNLYLHRWSEDIRLSKNSPSGFWTFGMRIDDVVTSPSSPAATQFYARHPDIIDFGVTFNALLLESDTAHRLYDFGGESSIEFGGNPYIYSYDHIYSYYHAIRNISDVDTYVWLLQTEADFNLISETVYENENVYAAFLAYSEGGIWMSVIYLYDYEEVIISITG